MKILYAIQGTGNGHITRAMDIAPELEKHGKVDYMVSGAQVDLDFPYDIKYRSKGLSFYFGKKGGIDLTKTFSKNSSKRVWNEINQLPIEDYDLIVNDFEPISAWAARFKGRKAVGLSHQSALLSDKCPKPKSIDYIGQSILKNYAPTDARYGFHFDVFDDNIFTPIVRKEIRDKEIGNFGHFTVYLPAYSDEKIIKVLSQIKSVDWKVFSKHSKERYWKENVVVEPINSQKFIESISSGEGVLCGAGFETPSEALFLGKKLLVIPMKGQYEQQCNAIALKEMGIPVLKKLSNKKVDQISEWVKSGMPLKKDYPDETEKIVEQIIQTEIGR